MSVNYYSGQVQQHERRLGTLRSKRVGAVKKVTGFEKDIARITRQAKSTNSDSMRANYLRQIENKDRDLIKAKEAESKVSIEISDTESKLAKAKAKLADAEASEQRKEERKAESERKRRERDQAAQARKEKSATQQRERESARSQQEQAYRETEQEHQIGVLQNRATELEEKLAAAERKAAPPEIVVLFLASNPEDQTQLRLDRESREIQKRVRASDFRDSIFFEWRLARQLPDLIQDLNEVAPHILHFSGHGDADALVFEDADGDTRELSQDQLGRLLAAGNDQIRLAVFNCCDSAPLAATACEHVDIAIGMSSSIGDEVAKAFAGQFYNSLGFGRSVAEAFRQAVLQVELEHGEDEDVPELFSADGVDAETVVLVNPAE